MKGRKGKPLRKELRMSGTTRAGNQCEECEHFLSLHNGRGCTVQWCECKLRSKHEA